MTGEPHSLSAKVRTCDSVAHSRLNRFLARNRKGMRTQNFVDQISSLPPLFCDALDDSSVIDAMISVIDASLAPSHVQATCISPTSVKIEWLPGNSSFCHEIVVNGSPQRLVRPGTYQHTLMNLEPDQDYEVHVRTKNPKQVLQHGQEQDVDSDPLASSVVFRTEPGGIRIDVF